MHCIDIIRFVKRNVYHIFPLKKEETDQLKRASGGDDEDAVIVLQRWDHWPAEALIVEEDIPTFLTVQLPSDSISLGYHPLLWLQHFFFSIHCFHDASRLISSTIRLTLDLTEGRDSSAFAPSSSSAPSLLSTGKVKHRYDKNKMTTKNPTYSHTIRVQTLWKMSSFSSHFYTKCKGCFGNQEFILPPLRYESLIIALDVNHNSVIVFTTVPWYWRTAETFGTGLMHNINKCKQTSQWSTN